MRDFSKVSPTVWRSRKFKALGTDDQARLAYLYLLTNPHANSTGCYDLPTAYAATDLGWSDIAYAKALDRLSLAGLILVDQAENTVLVTNWVTFNIPTNPKHALGLLDQLDDASSSQLKSVRFHELKEAILAKQWDKDRAVGGEIRKRIDSLSIAYGKPFATKTETETQTEKERETKTERETESIRTVVARARGEKGNGSDPHDELAIAPEGVARSSLKNPEEHPLLQTPYMRHARAKE